MADKKYTFPEGTLRIKPKELYDIFCKYEVVEIPGSVAEVVTQDNRDAIRSSILKKLILNEGTITLCADIGKKATYNIPTTLLQIECNGIAPKVVCLKEGFQRSNNWQVSEVEYLQAYTTADIRWNKFQNLKHYVYLGDRIKNWGHSPFEYIPAGCVIHVENKNMAKSVLKKCDVFSHYVVVDAEEWKDFPADKLAMTMEEYDPESRILPIQIKMREESRLQKDAEEKKKQEEHRQLQKQKVMVDLSVMVIAPVIEPLLGPKSQDRFGRWVHNYNVSAVEHEQTGESLVAVNALLANDLWDGLWNSSLWLQVRFTTSEVADKINIYADHFKRIKSFVEENRALIGQYNIRMGGDNFKPVCPLPGIKLPFLDTAIVAEFNTATMHEDLTKIKDFADNLEGLVRNGQKDFSLGFNIIPKG